MQLILTESKKLAQKTDIKCFSPFYEKWSEDKQEWFNEPRLCIKGAKKVDKGYNLHIILNITSLIGKTWNNGKQIWGHAFRYFSTESEQYTSIKKWVTNSPFDKNGKVILEKGGKGTLGHFVADYIFVEIDDSPKNKGKNQFYQIGKIIIPSNAKFMFKGCGFAPEMQTVDNFDELIEQV